MFLLTVIDILEEKLEFFPEYIKIADDLGYCK